VPLRGQPLHDVAPDPAAATDDDDPHDVRSSGLLVVSRIGQARVARIRQRPQSDPQSD
jgi:hypothetical protein